MPRMGFTAAGMSGVVQVGMASGRSLLARLAPAFTCRLCSSTAPLLSGLRTCRLPQTCCST
eukprot:3152568-Alexandrium_andersonii.AAC.1